MHHKGASNSIRIIGGLWRGRRVHFASLTDLRPTKDAVRETLFNWLSAYLPGSRCLDLFAGSGALGFEAASRGAAEVVMVESDAQALVCLRQAQQQLDAGQVSIQGQSAERFLHHYRGMPFDIVFLDPPFASDYLAQSLKQLAQQDLLKPDGLIYFEAVEKTAPGLPHASWTIKKHKRTGDVSYGLINCSR